MEFFSKQSLLIKNNGALHQYGDKFYTGTTLNGAMHGIGTLYNRILNQFVCGEWRSNQLSKILEAQFLGDGGRSTYLFKKFGNYHLFCCPEEGLILKLQINLSDLQLSRSFREMFKDICKASTILSNLEDNCSYEIEEFILKHDQSWSNIEWNRAEYRRSHDFLIFSIKFSEALKKMSQTIDLLQVIIASNIFESKSACFAYCQRSRTVIFTNPIPLKFNLALSIKNALKQVTNNYRDWLVKNIPVVFQSYVKKLEFPLVFWITKYDIDILEKTVNMCGEYNIPFHVETVFQDIYRKLDLQMPVIPVILSSFPYLIQALAELLKELSNELNMSYEQLLEKYFSKNVNIETSGLNAFVLDKQLTFLVELIEFYRPANIKGTNHEHIKEKSFFKPFMKTRMPCLEFLDLLDIAISSASEYIDAKYTNSYFDLFQGLVPLFFEAFVIINPTNSFLHWFSLVQHYRKLMIIISNNIFLLKDSLKREEVKKLLLKQLNLHEIRTEHENILTCIQSILCVKPAHVEFVKNNNLF